MDTHRFDDLTRVLAAGTSRRRVPKTLLAGAGAGTLAVLGMHRGAEAAESRPPGAACVANRHCASGVCDPATRS